MANDNETSAPAPAAAAAEKKRAAVSKRVLLDATGKETDDYIGAGGFKYESLSEPGTSVTAMFEGEGALPMATIFGLAAFGGLTLAGNVTNTIRNGEPKADGPQTEREALEAWLRELVAGNWTRPTGEVEIGIGLLAEAVARHFTAKDGKTRDADAVAKILDWLKGLDKDTRKGWKQDPGVQVHMKRIQTERAEAKAAAAGAAGGMAMPEGVDL